MADGTFRPRKINPNDVGKAGGEAPHMPSFEEVAEMRRAAGMNVPDEDMPRQGNTLMSDNMANRPNIEGKFPQQAMKLMADSLKEDMGEPEQHMPTRGPAPKNLAQQALSNGPANQNNDVIRDIMALVKKHTDHYEEIMLPSKGKFYDGTDGPSDGIIRIRPMTGQEEKIIATPRFVKKGQAINMIFKNCMQNKFDPDEFLSADREYLLIYLRGISYTPDYEVQIECAKCNTEFTHTVNLDALYMEYCPDEFTQESLIDVLPKTGLKFKYRLSRGRDESAALEHRERRIKNWGDNAHDDSLLFRASLLIEYLETENGTHLTGQHNIMAVLEQLPIQDVSYIRNLVTDTPFGVDTDIRLVCPSCVQEFKTRLPFDVNFFLPRTRKKMADPR